MRTGKPVERALAEIAGGIGTFEWALASDTWEWTDPIAQLFGFESAASIRGSWQEAIFIDDLAKLRGAAEEAARSGSFYAEFRVRQSAGGIRWLAGKGEVAAGVGARRLHGVFYDITDRKQLEVRLLALNETLEAQVAEAREEARTLEILNRTGTAVAAELNLQRLVQMVTDACVELTGAAFGAFFYNLLDERGESYTLYALAGASREAFAKFPMPRNTAVFEPTFRGRGPVRSDDILADPRYGKNAPYRGMPEGHLPVRSYLAIPVVSRSGEVLGGLFFGHPQPGVFTERSERIVLGIAGQTATAMDNARLYEAGQRELAARRKAEQDLIGLNETLEERIAEALRQREAAEETLRQAQKMEAIGQLTGGIAHDFNNLLTVIGGNLEHLERRLPEDDERRRFVAASLRGAWRAARLTQQLLAFSRRQPLVPEVLAINRLVAGMSELLQRTLGESIAVETVLAAGLWTTFIDANQLENALINLAVNARDAMPTGGKLTIETANSYLDESYATSHDDIRPGQYVGLFITDTGTGMTEEVATKAFDPFFTTKGVGHGTGLGLSQVYGFVRQSGGHVKIYSEPGHGTTVRLYLPRHHSADIAEQTEQRTLAPPRAREGETVLLVEDDADVRSYSSEIVRDLGYRVLTAPDGPAALLVLDDHPEVGLLFTDVGLPAGMNGRQLADEAQRRRPGLKVLFTTGYARNAIVHDGRLDADVEVVFKPFTYSDLGTKLRRVFDKETGQAPDRPAPESRRTGESAA
jgi:signal transduction histidine kinase/CheY-like chemotaxis protein